MKSDQYQKEKQTLISDRESLNERVKVSPPGYSYSGKEER